MKIRLVFLLLTAALWACSKPPKEYKDLRSRFQSMAEQIGQDAPCSREIPGEWSPSLPVPALASGALHYRVFFSGWSGRPTTKIVYYDAQGDAEFTPEGKVLTCAQRGAERKALAAEPLPARTQKEFDERVRGLYASIEEMGRLYARGLPVLEKDRLRVKDFSTEFSRLTGPARAAAYRALSPEFWAWVEKNGGA